MKTKHEFERDRSRLLSQTTGARRNQNVYETIVTRADSVKMAVARSQTRREESEVKISEGRGIPRTREDDRAKSKRLTRQEVETLEFFAKVTKTIVKKVRPREEQQRVSSKDRECEKRVDFEVGEERNEDGKSGALMLRPDLEEMSKSHRERRDRTRVGGESTLTLRTRNPKPLYIRSVPKAKRNETRLSRKLRGRNCKMGESKWGVKTRVTSKVGCSVGKGAWPNDSAGDHRDAHYEYKEWSEIVRDEVKPTLVKCGDQRASDEGGRGWNTTRQGTMSFGDRMGGMKEMERGETTRRRE
ncbi:hypothetical protein EDB83DRAFT_2317164 [Lactarius deliciosus]|nr:hypothetical protein EDB83DRAFT_2317164 [Lactarius deliciosus]